MNTFQETLLLEDEDIDAGEDKRMKISMNSLLIVDDELAVGEAMKRQAIKAGYEVILTSDPEIALAMLSTLPVGVILSDYVMPGMDGIQFLEKARKMRPDTVQILTTGHASIDNATESINRLHIFGFLIKPWQQIELLNLLHNAFQHYRMIVENQRLQELTGDQNLELKKMNETLENRVQDRTKTLNEVLDETIVMLSIAAEEKDDNTGEHTKRMREMTEDMCLAMGMQKTAAERIGMFSILHDIGKIHIPDNILKKPGKLTCQEWEIMKQHTIAGERILGSHSFYGVARQIARSHHENWDGSGYPDGLSGVDIPLAARIVAIADVFDALTSRRPYKEPWKIDKSLEEIARQKSKKFDPDLTEIFISVQQKKAADRQLAAERRRNRNMEGLLFQEEALPMAAAG